MKTVAIAISAMRQSTNHMVPKPDIKALPPLKPYHTGQQCPIITKSPVKAAPNCPQPKMLPNTIIAMLTGIIALTMSKTITTQAAAFSP